MKIDPEVLADARSRVDGCPSDLPLVAAPEQTVAAMVVCAGFIVCLVILLVAWVFGGVT